MDIGAYIFLHLKLLTTKINWALIQSTYSDFLHIHIFIYSYIQRISKNIEEKFVSKRNVYFPSIEFASSILIFGVVERTRTLKVGGSLLE